MVTVLVLSEIQGISNVRLIIMSILAIYELTPK